MIPFALKTSRAAETSRATDPRTALRSVGAWLVLALVGFGLVAGALHAQETQEENVAALPAGTAQLTFNDRQVARIPFTVTRQGPLFALPVVAEILGVELTVGPLGDSHRLHFEDSEVVVGPESAVAVIVDKERRREKLMTFSRPPIKRLTGLEVPLDFLLTIFGDQLGWDFRWDADALELALERREVRQVEATIDVIHQLSTTIEIGFSELPRWRVERQEDALGGVALDIVLVGDRLALPIDTTRATSPLLRGIDARVDRLRIELEDGAEVAEPWLIEGPPARLVVEVFQKRSSASRGGDQSDDEDTTPGFTARPSGVRTIVIDPGHGGIESGAVGIHGTQEKDLTLTVARSLKRLLERRLPVRVVLTRDRDVDLPHETRTAIANQNQADLFISIHFNSSYGRQAHGAETFFLSREASDQLAADVAASENQKSAEDDGNPEGDLQLILWDLAQSYHLAESQRFANLVQEELNVTLGLRDRGVKQAPFRVLMGATMPAVLVELGFLSNPDEEKKLQNPIYQAELVDSLYRAVRRFKTQLEAREAPADAAADSERRRQP